MFGFECDQIRKRLDGTHLAANFGDLGRAGAGTSKGRWRTNAETPNPASRAATTVFHIVPPNRPLHAMPPVVNAYVMYP